MRNPSGETIRVYDLLYTGLVNFIFFSKIISYICSHTSYLCRYNKSKGHLERIRELRRCWLELLFVYEFKGPV